ncbi:LamG-like jellyroll fold domain-containing protein [Streptomyces chrestomyceticus]|uniref:LamG-like jellyroll fold domain-containing protein n=1 Tax=Streptomyces chrestomyceticus TaxID=68185 RepID=UPI0036BEFBFB
MTRSVRRRRGASRLLVWLLGAAVSVSLLPGLPAAQAQPRTAHPAPVARTAAARPAQAATEQAALAQAKSSDTRVEVTSARGESREVFATPEGNLEAREYLRPVRARIKGRWREIDTDLAAAGDGSVAPKATTVDLRFSGGGTGPLVRMQRTGRELALSWPARLPAPVLEGPTATYRDVLPEVDLRMGAQADGFTQLLVVKTARAAASAELAQLRLKLSATGLQVKETAGGGLEAIDEGAKATVFEAPTPLMWDSSPGRPAAGTAGSKAARAGPAAEREAGQEPGAGESGKLAPVGVQVPAGQGEVVLKPDADVLTGKDTVYPVFIDPQWSSPRAAAWTVASQYWASSPQWKFNGENNAGLGYCGWNYCKPNDTKRLFYRVPTAAFAGKAVLKAEFVVNSIWAASCSAREVQLWRTRDISSATTWNTQNADGFWQRHLKTSSFAYGYEGCAARDAEFDVKAAVQEAADHQWPAMTFGLRATDEDDRYGWKRFSDKAFLRVQYNRPPAQIKMSQLAMEYGGVCKKPETAARTRTLGKIYANNVSDPDGDSVAVQFQAKWDAGDGKGTIARWQPGRTTAKKSGSSFALSLPASIPANRQIFWYARAWDGAQYSPWSFAGAATACYFVYDTSVPKAPAVTSGEYPASDPDNPDDPWYDGVGQYGTFTLHSASGDVTRYRWNLNGDPWPTHEIATSAGAPQKAMVLPARPGLNFVTAQAFDAAGNGSEIRTYQFRVKAGQPDRAAWQLDEPAGAQQAQGTAPARTARLYGGARAGADGLLGSALLLNGSDAYAAADLPVVDTDRGYALSAWVRPSEKPQHAAVVAAQAGNRVSGTELYYSADLDRWVFNQYAKDDPGAPIVRAMAPAPGGLTPGQWTHLIGSYDPVAKKLQLFVNGKLAGETPYSATWNARRGLHIGAASYAGTVSAHFPGAIDELHIFDKQLTAPEVAKLYAKQHLTGPERPAVAVFDLDEQPGATDISGRADVLPAQFHGGAKPGAPGVAGNAVSFNGTDAYARVNAPHLNTARSFTVSAWARLDTAKPSHAAVVAAQAGAHAPGFELYYSADLDRWVFNQYTDDAPTGTPVRATGPRAAGGTWAHLVGVHDTIADTLTLYVNGQKAGAAKLNGAFYAAGPLLIGAGSYRNSALGSYFPGQIDDVRLFDRPVSAEEVQQLFAHRPLLAGRWQFDQSTGNGTGPVTTPDALSEARPMALYGDAKLTPEAAFMGSNGLLLDGTGDYAATSTVPVDTSESFTVAAWVQAAAVPKGASALLSADGEHTSAFAVGFVPAPGDPQAQGRWQFAMAEKDTADAPLTPADNAQGFHDVREWNHLAVVYDGLAKQARLYVNGTLEALACTDADGDGDADSSACADQVPWAENVLSFQAVKTLQVGRAKGRGSWGEYWPGAVDDLWAFQGALSEAQVRWLAEHWSDVPTEVPQP